MDNMQTFEEFLASTTANIPIISFFVNIVLTALLAFALKWIYVNYGMTLSNRRLFAKTFILTSMTTMLIITIVKSSLALSLGLVGALSIIRFRSAIKEPEELSYLFLSIAIGLGFGASQPIVTLLGFLVITSIIIINKSFSNKSLVNDQNIYLKVSKQNKKLPEIEKIVDILTNNFSSVDLRRLDETKELSEISFLVEIDEFDQLSKAKKELQKLDKDIDFMFLNNDNSY